MKIEGQFLHILFALIFCTQVFGAGGVLPGEGSEAAPYLIEDLDDFLAFVNPGNAAAYWSSGVHVELSCDIDLTGRSYDSAVIAPDTVVGDTYFTGTPYKGSFNGNGFEISNMSIDDNNTGAIYVGLFGFADGAVIENLAVVNCSVNIGVNNNSIGRLLWNYGPLCGKFDDGSISNCSATGNINAVLHTSNINQSSLLDIGGLCGYFNGVMTGCHSSCSLNISTSGYYSMQLREIGGLCGYADGSIRNCYATGPVTPEISLVSGYAYAAYYLDTIGGLCGQNDAALDKCYSSGQVQCTANNNSLSIVHSIGGLIGYNRYGEISNCYTQSSVSASSTAGTRTASCYNIGGFIGINSRELVENCYSGAEFSASASAPNTSLLKLGGFCGSNNGTITESFWDSELSEMTESAGGSSKTTAQMQNKNSFISAGWDFDSTDGAADWVMPAAGYPKLYWEESDDIVDFEDFAMLAGYWGYIGCDQGEPCDAADWYDDGVIDYLDLNQLAQSWLSDQITIN